MQIDDCLSVRDGRLRIEACDVGSLAERFGTPLYVVSEDQLRRRARAFTAAFGAAWPHGPVRVLPSIKANYTLALRAVLSDEGLGCDAFGAGELEAALRAGTPPPLISLNGSSKDRALIERAVALGVRITADSVAELDMASEVARQLGRTARVRVRVRPELTADAPSDLFGEPVSVREAVARYKPGIPTAELLGVRAPELPGVEITGVMLHIGRHGADPGLWVEAIGSLARIAAALRDAWGGWEPAEIDVGGGFPLPRDPTGRTLARRAGAPVPPPLERYAEAIGGALERALRAVGIDPAGRALEVEPGRALYGDAGIHLTRVLGIKREGERTWIETDSSEAFLPDGLLEHIRWTVVATARSGASAGMVADVVGRSCTFDVIAADAQLPAIEAGEVLAVLDTGAYQDAGASNFNALPRPGTILVSGREAELVRRAETVDDVFARDAIPARLGGAMDGAGVRGLDHVSVACADLDRSLAFYRDLLGLPVRDRGGGSAGAVGEIVGTGDAQVEWADLALPDGRVLELLRLPGGPPSAGSGHFALGVVEAETVHRRLRGAGVPLRSEPVTIDDDGDWKGARCFYAEDPDGTVVELIERPPRGVRVPF
jgi:diaminopimelate decarboxylase